MSIVFTLLIQIDIFPSGLARTGYCHLQLKEKSVLALSLFDR